ncbi:MAG TPA: NADH-quinone oxidoreductase subunit I [Syntrophales bacterium]|nr:NADH-quinone oxidoreductase subunit I [Syntrophales bacterium]HQN76770.1 NADH-quinone oxidoreductase subunit I [Syntrophales bacterium]HQQ27444.1 NADH-quinone oxidoreductase subunit I [Syntrophales bacterium]
MKALARGLALTFRTFFRRPVTEEYPDVKRPLPPRFRGRPVLLAREDGRPRCVACGLCERVCPSSCIAVEPGTGPGGTRTLARYELDLGRCSFCGLCVEACPVEAIAMGDRYELAVEDRRELLYETDRLLSPLEGNNGSHGKEDRNR